MACPLPMSREPKFAAGTVSLGMLCKRHFHNYCVPSTEFLQEDPNQQGTNNHQCDEELSHSEGELFSQFQRDNAQVIHFVDTVRDRARVLMTNRPKAPIFLRISPSTVVMSGARLGI